MSNQDDIKILTRIKKTHERIVLTSGITMGILLSSYFFTFAMLIDRNAVGMLWFELLSAIAFIFGLVYIKALGFFLTKLLLGFKEENRPWLDRLSIKALDKDVDVLAAELKP